MAMLNNQRVCFFLFRSKPRTQGWRGHLHHTTSSVLVAVQRLSQPLPLGKVGRFCWVGLQKTLKATERRGPSTCSVVVLYVLDPILFFGSWWIITESCFLGSSIDETLWHGTICMLSQKHDWFRNTIGCQTFFCYQLNSMFDGLRFLWFAWIIPKLFAIEKTQFIS